MILWTWCAVTSPARSLSHPRGEWVVDLANLGTSEGRKNNKSPYRDSQSDCGAGRGGDAVASAAGLASRRVIQGQSLA